MAHQSGAHGRLQELALFAGAGGGVLGGHLLGWQTVCAVENDPYAIAVLCARQNDGVLPPFPIWDDVCTFDGRPWRGIVDVVSGGFPCTDISAAGKGAGIDGAASGLWSEMARIVGEVRPRYVFVENSPLLVSRGLARVLSDLAALGYDARWGVLGADDAGAPHRRKRIWIVAHAQGIGHGEGGEPGDVREAERGQDGRLHGVACGAGDVADANGERLQEQRCALTAGAEYAEPERSDWWLTEPDVGRVANGVAARVDRLKCIGNGQVPRVAALAWEILTGCDQ